MGQNRKIEKENMTKTLLTIVVVLLSTCAMAQLPDAPADHRNRLDHSFRNVLIANAALYSSSLVGAHATSQGSHACFMETRRDTGRGFVGVLPSGEHIGLVHPYQTYFRRSLPIDAGITAVSLWASHRHHNLLATLLPSTAAGFQLGVAGMEYSAGCF